MRKSSLLTIVLTLLSIVCMGNPVDPATARLVAANFWSAVTNDSDDERWTDITAQTGYHEFYIFTHNVTDGFVIVAADNRVQPILGYSTDNPFVTPLPAHTASFLQGYELEIAYYREQGFEASEEIASLWNRLIGGVYTPEATTAVAPMLTTTWDQSPYYNYLCPDSAGQHAVTGCTATATAQIMKYWNWPPTGEGSHSYTDDNMGYQYADFGATTYDWAHMPNKLSGSSNSTQLNAVATLMYHVGVAVEMDYGLHASGAFVHAYSGWENMACSEHALPQYFGYKNTLHSYFKDYTSDINWINAITAELDAGRPVLESGYGDGGGHAFVCDGYDNNGLFHINWGWSGYYDGYFAHNALNPGGAGTGGNNSYTFNDGKGILVGIEPDGLLAVSPTQLFLPQEGGISYITVSPNANDSNIWYSVSNQPWLTLSPNNGNGVGGSATVTVTATANTTSSNRTATITVTQGSKQQSVQVTQVYDSCMIVNLPWSDSFEEGMGCWTTLDADDNDNNWFLATGASNSGDLSMASYSYISSLGALHANNYLVSPAIALPTEGENELIFYARCGNANYPDTVMVKLSTGDGTALSQFGNTLMPLTPVNTTSYQQFRVSLSAYSGQVVKVAIVHRAYDGTYLAIDDISFVNTASTCNITALSANGSMGAASGSGTYNAGQDVTLTATAGSSHRFTGWNDGSTLNPREIVATGNATYTASFADLGGSEHHYDNGTSASHIGAGGTLYWGIRFPAGELSEYTTLSGARIWNYSAGSYELRIYQGGTEAPGTLVASQTYTLTGGDSLWFDAVLSTPVTLNHNQPLWIIFYNTGTSHPAAACHYVGNPDGSWVSLNGNNWASICDYGFNLTWQIRATLTGSTSAQRHTLTVNSGDQDKGVISGGGRFLTGDSTLISATALPGFRFTSWNDGETNNPRWITVTSDSTVTAHFADLGDAERHYDNGTRAGSIGANGSLYWGVRFPSGSLSGYEQMNGIRIFDYNAGTFELSIFQGGNDAPGTLVTSQTLTLSGTNDWQTVALTTPVSLNQTTPLWIVIYNSGVNYPAVGSHYAGNPDGSWVSLNGENWSSVCDYNYYYTWMIRAELSNTEPMTFYTITAGPDNTSHGSVTGSGIYPDGTTVLLNAIAAANHHFTKWNDGVTENPRTVTVTENATYTATFQANEYQINVVSEQPEMGTVAGGGSYPYGTTIQIEAIPYTGYEFWRWTGGNTDNPRTVTVTANKTYSAIFRETVGIEEMAMPEVEIYSNGNQIMVNGAGGLSVEIYDMAGKLVTRENANDSDRRVFTVASSGTYLVRTSNGIAKKVTVIY